MDDHEDNFAIVFAAMGVSIDQHYNYQDEIVKEIQIHENIIPLPFIRFHLKSIL